MHFRVAIVIVAFIGLIGLMPSARAQDDRPVVNPPVPPADQSVPPARPPADRQPQQPPTRRNPATSDNTQSTTPQPPNRPRPSSRRPPVRRRTLRVARAPNMFGDFFEAPATIVFSQPLSDSLQDSGQTTTTGVISNPAFGGGPRLKISDNFSPIPRHRIYVQGHHFRNLFATKYQDSSYDGGIAGDRSVWVTTFGVELLSIDESYSVELRLPLISAPSTNNVLSGSFIDNAGSQSSSGSDLANLSLILKHVLDEGDDHFLSGGIGLTVPTAEDVTGNIGDLNYSVENGTTNIVPFLSVLFRPRQNLFVQIHAQVDVPLGGDDFNYSEADTFGIPNPQAGSFGTYRESILAAIDVQIARQFYAPRTTGLIRGMTGVIEFRLTQALNSSGSVVGAAAEDIFAGEEVEVDFAQDDPTPTYLNFTFGVQTDFANEWHLRVGQVVPLIDNNSFTAETILQFEKRL